jgi:hypothetical protein
MSSKYECVVCKKVYLKKSSLDKHKVLCDFRFKTSRERQVEMEEKEDIPSYEDLVKIVQHLMMQMEKMEGKMEEMGKWVTKKKRKVDVLSWLNCNVHASVGFTEWMQHWIQVTPAHLDTLKENNAYVTMHRILEDNVKNVAPIYCFVLKPSTFYGCEMGESGQAQWRKLEPVDLFHLFQKVHFQLTRYLAEWKLAHKKEMEEDDYLCILFNKMLYKVMSVEIYNVGDASVTKLRQLLYHSLKADNADLAFE